MLILNFLRSLERPLIFVLFTDRGVQLLVPPSWWFAVTPHGVTLCLVDVTTIRPYSVVLVLELGGHCQSERGVMFEVFRRQSVLLFVEVCDLEESWKYAVIFTVPLCVSTAETECVEQKPRDVCWILVLPQSAGVMSVTLCAVDAALWLGDENSMSVECPWAKHLCGFDRHFDHELVGQCSCCDDRVLVNGEDVHVWWF